ncbi:MAG: hypothetical protein IJV00_07510 [Clostridia bacterium]|nr:hypothetical protein [Clostridia bacterium]
MSNFELGWIFLAASAVSAVLLAVFLRRICVLFKRGYSLSAVMLICAAVVLAAVMCVLVPYSWPYDITVKPEKVAEIRSPEKLSTDTDGWYCVYSIDGLFGTSRDSYRALPQIRTESGFPEMDLDRYTYLFSFGKEISALKYNVWDSLDKAPFDLGMSGKWARADFSGEVSEYTVYVYRFPRAAVDNAAGTKYEEVTVKK